MPTQSARNAVMAPERPNSRISASPMTNGGVMIGSTEMMRIAPLKRKPVRVAISAKASPSSVDSTPTITARNSVFQATPHCEPPDRQASPQIERSKKSARNFAGAALPALSWKALISTLVMGKNTNRPISPATSAIEEMMKASPLHHPFKARPWQSRKRNPSAVTAAPAPMPPCVGPGSPDQLSRIALL